MADETIKTVREWARAAKRAQEAAGEEQMSDEILMRASLSWWMVCRDLERVTVGDEVINAAASRRDDGSHQEECRCSKCIAREKVGRASGGKVSDG